MEFLKAMEISIIYLLTPKEIAVLEAFGSGKDTSEVMKALKIKAPTLSSHLARIFEKLGIEGTKGKTMRAVLKYKEEKAKL